MEDRDRTYHTIWFVAAIIALAAWNVYQFRQANTERGELRARISELFDESELASDKAQDAAGDAADLSSTLASREKRFKTMSFACARMINGLEREAWVMGEVIGRVIRGEWSPAQVLDWADGEAQYQAHYAWLVNEDRALCGMRTTKDNPLKGPREVAPVKQAWIEGVDPPT